jgi:hypothetical protein
MRRTVVMEVLAGTSPRPCLLQTDGKGCNSARETSALMGRCCTLSRQIHTRGSVGCRRYRVGASTIQGVLSFLTVQAMPNRHDLMLVICSKRREGRGFYGVRFFVLWNQRGTAQVDLALVRAGSLVIGFNCRFEEDAQCPCNSASCAINAERCI